MSIYTELNDELAEAGFHEDAAIALTAAYMVRRVGRWAAVRYAVKRGCPMRLVKLAMALEYDAHDDLYQGA